MKLHLELKYLGRIPLALAKLWDEKGKGKSRMFLGLRVRSVVKVAFFCFNITNTLCIFTSDPLP